jgi:hypothetical protein
MSARAFDNRFLEETKEHPLDIAQRAAVIRDWIFERESEHELGMIVEGRVAAYRLVMSFQDVPEAVQIGCTFDINVPAPRQAEVGKLLLSATSRLWFGHFEHWAEDRMIILRHSVILAGGCLELPQLETMLDAMITACDRFYPAFHYVSWASLTAEAALDVVTFNTEGAA